MVVAVVAGLLLLHKIDSMFALAHIQAYNTVRGNCTGHFHAHTLNRRASEREIERSEPHSKPTSIRTTIITVGFR